MRKWKRIMSPPITECNNATMLIVITNHRIHKKKGIISYQEKNGGPFPAMGEITGMQSTLVLMHINHQSRNS
jgi:hypothetical protein